MKSYRTLALKELLSQKVTSILILIAVVLSTMMTTIVGQSIGVLSAMREQQAIAIGGNRYATFLQMNADQLHALEQDERLSYVGKSIYMGSLELSPSLTLGLTEYLDDTAAIYPSSTSIEEGHLPEAPMEIALSEDILKYLGFEGGIGDRITLSLQKNLRHNIADSYSYTAEFVLTGILKNNYLGYTSGTVTGVVGEGTAEQLLPASETAEAVIPLWEVIPGEYEEYAHQVLNSNAGKKGFSYRYISHRPFRSGDIYWIMEHQLQELKVDGRPCFEKVSLMTDEATIHVTCSEYFFWCCKELETIFYHYSENHVEEL